MACRPSVFVLGLVALAGCLEEGPAPSGRHLFHSQKVVSPGFMDIGQDHFVSFRELLEPATQQKGAVYNLWFSSFDGQTQRKYVSNWSDRWPTWDSAGGHYFMVEERMIPGGGGSAVVGSWIRLNANFEEELRIEDLATVSPFSASLSSIYQNPQSGQTCPGYPDRTSDCPQALFERPPPVGQSYPTLVLWDGAYQTPIGQDVGGFQNQIMGSGIYCILGDKHTLSRFGRPSNAIDSLRDNVSSFSVSGDEHYVALAVTDDNKSRTVIHNLRTGVEITPARPNPSGWGGFGTNVFTYSQNGTSTSPAEVHTLNLDTGEDTFTTLPEPLVNLAGSLDRPPNGDERLVLDSVGHGVFVGKDDLTVRRTIMGPLLVPSFTPDGKYLIYIQRGTSTLFDTDPQGALVFQDADNLDDPPQIVSPPGLILVIRCQPPYFPIGNNDGFAFWAHLGRGASDLYFMDYPGGGLPTNVRLIARSIMSVSVSAESLFGIINVSQQDDVGDLVLRDIVHGKDTRYSQAVSDASESLGSDLLHSCTVYNVRGRADSDRSGLWISSLAPPLVLPGGDQPTCMLQ